MASKSKTVAELIEVDGDIVVNALDHVDPSFVSDKDNSSTGQLTLPAGTTAQRPGTSYTGAQRYNTDLGVMEYYNGSQWLKIAAEQVALDSVSGTIYAGYASTLTLTGQGFLTDDITVNFTQASDGIDEDVVVTASSDTSATVTVPSAVYNNVTSGNAVTIVVTNADSTNSGGVNKTASGIPSGGTEVTSGNYKYYTFTTSGYDTLTIPSGFSTTLEYLVVAGGGGGSRNSNPGGGGGAGGLLQSSQSVNGATTSSLSIRVGAGGAGQGSGTGTQGTNSHITGTGWTTVESVGGGGGAGSDVVAGSGGSGGGASYQGNGGGSGTAGQGNDGGNGSTSGGVYSGGGGGGKGAAGDTSSGGSVADGGIGGLYSDWATATSTGDGGYYAGGGGAGTYANSRAANGGQGGGADGINSTTFTGTGNHGAANTGGGGGGIGGGGSGGIGGNGGSGIVIVRFDTTAL